VSLTARHLEENGIPTVIMGSAKDIVEHCGVPRFVFSDFPLGNSAGKPNDPTSQAEMLELALKVLESAPGPRTTVQSPQRWSDDPEWKLDYQNVERIPTDELRRLRSEFDRILHPNNSRRGYSGNLEKMRVKITFYQHVYEESLSIGNGIQFKSHDVLEFGVNWSKAAFDPGLPTQTVAEIYYRMMITEHLAISPNFQYVWEPAQNQDLDSVYYFQLRFRLTF
jgi:hypothetical protein